MANDAFECGLQALHCSCQSALFSAQLLLTGVSRVLLLLTCRDFSLGRTILRETSAGKSTSLALRCRTETRRPSWNA